MTKNYNTIINVTLFSIYILLFIGGVMQDGVITISVIFNRLFTAAVQVFLFIPLMFAFSMFYDEKVSYDEYSNCEYDKELIKSNLLDSQEVPVAASNRTKATYSPMKLPLVNNYKNSRKY